MCLTYKDKVHRKPVKKTVYKLMEKKNGKYVSYVTNTEMPIGKTIKDTAKGRINGARDRMTSKLTTYMKGFHAFGSKRGAISRTKYYSREPMYIFKGELLVKTEGTEGDYDVFVGSELKLTKKVFHLPTALKNIRRRFFGTWC